jgi:ParB family chromosome partitioning protein
MFEEAEAMSGTLRLCEITQEELGRRLGVSQSYIANKLRLLSYTEGERDAIISLGLSERHARSILRLDESERLEMILKCGKGAISVRECEAMVDSRVAASLPHLIGTSERNDGIELFKDGMRRGVEALRSLGVEAGIRTSYDSDGTYITVRLPSGVGK